jgi:hypothetical protein
MKKFAVVLAGIAAVILVQGLTSPTVSTVDSILADASLAMAIPLFFVAMAFWASDNEK